MKFSSAQRVERRARENLGSVGNFVRSRQVMPGVSGKNPCRLVAGPYRFLGVDENNMVIDPAPNGSTTSSRNAVLHPDDSKETEGRWRAAGPTRGQDQLYGAAAGCYGSGCSKRLRVLLLLSTSRSSHQ